MQEDLTLGQFFLCLFLVFLFVFAVGIHPLWLDYLDERRKKKERLEQLKKDLGIE
ncbi:hypothetical protein [Campylobacter helveticus]|uniref:hypothetical protein n=1 Tax=Campylobacter helveticus TaxID=28898 RepID=UPI0009C3AA0B|nr:hypothetical protein [Campylobacter helveticus]ELU1350190.1 hypothetical protein [Campylobacter jejuni]ARE81415.1 hypothetical protein CHELV3228_a0040 [Campylobacter helveticus]MCR2039824.1 hypothetical protein [Campylobacter helveticus]MCR2054830.1 hypothetical protein [Campylobacter helveticus]MCR2060335.1 hypothetical protein [Campylobacter helveticus]